MRWLLSLAVMAAFVFAAGLAVAPPAHAQMTSKEAIQLQNEILQLRHEMQQMQSSGGNGSSAITNSQPLPAPAPEASGGNGNLVAQLLARVTTLEEEVRDLRGRIDEIDNSRQQAEADLKKQIGDLQFQLSQGAGAHATASAPTPTAPRPAPRAAVPAHPTPEAALARGDAALARRDYNTSEAMAREVLATAPHSPRAADAQYLLAESLAGKRDDRGAALAYDDAFRASPKGPKAQDSLLGLANALTGIGQKRAACETLNKLHATFPVLRPDLRAPATRAAQAAGCT